MIKLALLLPFSLAALSAQTHPLQSILDAARTQPAALRDLLAVNFPNLKKQGAALVWARTICSSPIRPTSPPSPSTPNRPPPWRACPIPASGFAL